MPRDQVRRPLQMSGPRVIGHRLQRLPDFWSCVPRATWPQSRVGRLQSGLLPAHRVCGSAHRLRLRPTDQGPSSRRPGGSRSNPCGYWAEASARGGGQSSRSSLSWQAMQRRTPGTADRRASGIAAPQFAHRLRDLPCGRRLWVRRMPSLTVASICSLTALSPAQPVAM